MGRTIIRSIQTLSSTEIRTCLLCTTQSFLAWVSSVFFSWRSCSVCTIVLIAYFALFAIPFGDDPTEPVYFYNGEAAQRLGNTAMNFKFGGYYYYGSDYGNYMCPNQCNTDDQACSVPDLVLSYGPFASGTGWNKLMGQNVRAAA